MSRLINLKRKLKIVRLVIEESTPQHIWVINNNFKLSKGENIVFILWFLSILFFITKKLSRP